MSQQLRIGTRASQLALWQANWIKEQLIKRHPDLDIEIVRIKTTGDKILDVPLAKVGGKGLFVKEIESALLEGSIDLAVHSMKDVPTALPDGLAIVAVSEREDPRDALLSRERVPLSDLPKGGRIGTSSLRRQAQILHRRPDFSLEPLRGNINTRLRKLKEGRYDAIVLALAGVKRLGWNDEVTEVIEPDIMLPAIGQGALGIEARADDRVTLERIGFLDHPETSVCVAAERAFLRRLEGGCQVPIAAHATVSDGVISLAGLVASVDGAKFILRKTSGPSSGADEMGRSLAEQILDSGGREILEEVYCAEIE
ncbi:MAG: hydroxymethylbilane synthase [bacterium]|nr:MAG: hydroxymethylbilane synthase [bacterium]